MILGTVVQLKMSILGEPNGAVGVVFHVYDGGVQVIFENGGYDGFDEKEQKDFLEIKGVDSDSESYTFINVMKTTSDYENGLWDHVFYNKLYRPVGMLPF